jgi:hypothetical protein
MESINTVLSNRDFAEPEEILRLKAYISRKYDSASQIRISQKGLIISVKSSSLANVIRLSLPEIQRQLSIEQKLFIRIA